MRSDARGATAFRSRVLRPRTERGGRPELRCTTIFSEIQEHFDFFGGSSDEWLKYLLRPDLPADMWIFMPPSEVKAVSGVSAVMKKDGFHQRKLVMQCAANYMWVDPSSRGELGMRGGEALTRLHSAGGLCVASMDQNNAFTRVSTPEWMWPWSATPAVRAFEVWPLLSHIGGALRGPRQGLARPFEGPWLDWLEALQDPCLALPRDFEGPSQALRRPFEDPCLALARGFEGPGQALPRPFRSPLARLAQGLRRTYPSLA